MVEPIWKLTPRLGYHYWYHRRARFRLNEGAFDRWFALVPEEGVFSYRIAGVQGEASFGDVLICPPRVLFGRRILDRLTYHVFEWDWFDAEGRRAEPPPDALPAGKVSLRDVDRLSSDCALLRALEGRNDALSLARRALLFHDLLHLCYAQAGPAGGGPAPRDEAMQEAARQLQKRAPEPFSIKEVSDALGLSPVQFTRRFRAAFGVSPSHYLGGVRLRRARALLLETDMTIQAVAESCGYASGLYLSRIFTREMKMSPGRFRDSHRT